MARRTLCLVSVASTTRRTGGLLRRAAQSRGPGMYTQLRGEFALGLVGQFAVPGRAPGAPMLGTAGRRRRWPTDSPRTWRARPGRDARGRSARLGAAPEGRMRPSGGDPTARGAPTCRRGQAGAGGLRFPDQSSSVSLSPAPFQDLRSKRPSSSLRRTASTWWGPLRVTK